MRPLFGCGQHDMSKSMKGILRRALATTVLALSACNPEHANQWGELGPAGNIEHETRGAPLRIVITKNWHKDCFRFIPLFDPGTIPSPRPGAQFAAARRRRQGRPSRSRAANSDFARPHLDGGEHGGTLTPCRGGSRSRPAAPSGSYATPRHRFQFRFPVLSTAHGKCQRKPIE
jgi:hypothetical protein